MDTTGTRPIEDRITNCHLAIVKNIWYGNEDSKVPYWTIDTKMLVGDCIVNVSTQKMSEELMTKRISNVLNVKTCVLRKKSNDIFEFVGFL